MKKIKFNNNILYLIIAIIVILMLILRPQTGQLVETAEEEIVEETAGSGFLEVDTSPVDADIFVDGVFSGKSPDTIYNIVAGIHNVIIKKEGYENFAKQVSVEAGKRTVLDANLVLVQEVEEEASGVIEEGELEVVEETELVMEEKVLEEDLTGGKINIEDGILFYYDFSEGEFMDKRRPKHDIFSKRFEQYFVFTRFNPVNIGVIDKNINEVEKGDCIGTKGQFELLHSGKSLCVITKENQIVAIGGIWQTTENAELTWKVLS